MIAVKRSLENPFIQPNHDERWQAYSVFNPCVIKNNNDYHLLCRAQSPPADYHGRHMSLSTIGYAKGTSPSHFSEIKQFIYPEYDWEKFGCEDPRVTRLNNKYYIFYTAISEYPFQSHGIRVAVATTKDFKTIERKQLVTPFNAKAMALFPDIVNGKMVAILTADTDNPPSKIGFAYFDDESQLYSEAFWNQWYASLANKTLSLLRSDNDHVEVGSPPVKTEKGWLLIYSYIQNYYWSERRVFGIEAVLLDLNNPLKIIERTQHPLLIPEEQYELYGDVPNVIFPSGVLLENNKLHIYYGAADTTCCLATSE